MVTKSGNANAQFHGTLLSAPPAKATKINASSGTLCLAAYPNGGVTADWQATITPSGNVNGHCKFRAP